jgi:hypothetical protein
VQVGKLEGARKSNKAAAQTRAPQKARRNCAIVLMQKTQLTTRHDTTSCQTQIGAGQKRHICDVCLVGQKHVNRYIRKPNISAMTIDRDVLKPPRCPSFNTCNLSHQIILIKAAPLCVQALPTQLDHTRGDEVRGV